MNEHLDPAPQKLPEPVGTLSYASQTTPAPARASIWPGARAYLTSHYFSVLLSSGVYFLSTERDALESIVMTGSVMLVVGVYDFLIFALVARFTQTPRWLLAVGLGTFSGLATVVLYGLSQDSELMIAQLTLFAILLLGPVAGPLLARVYPGLIEVPTPLRSRY